MNVTSRGRHPPASDALGLTSDRSTNDGATVCVVSRYYFRRLSDSIRCRLEQLWKEELERSGPENATIRRVFIRFVRRRCMAAALALVLSLSLLLFAVVSIF